MLFIYNNNLIRKFYNIITTKHDIRLSESSGYCSKDSIGYLKYLKKKYNFTFNPRVINFENSSPSSNWPVYDNNLDNDLGFLHIKDLINNISSKNFELKDAIREVLYVAPKSPILDLLKRMRASRIHMGLVVDEFGGVDGLITIEDLVEEIVGEIEDEHDAEDEEILLKKINKNTILVDAYYKIDDLEKYFNNKIN